MRYIFIDESRITKRDRFQLFGSFWIPREKHDEFRMKYWQLWDSEFPSRSELHWVKVSKGKIETYKKFIDFFATFPGADFRCMVLDSRAIDYKKYHDGDKELGFYKFLYFFISRNIEKDQKYRNISDNYQLFLDRRKKENDIEVGKLQDLKLFLNKRLLNQCFYSRGVVRNVEATDSKISPEIQIADILMGAIGYSWEGFQTSPAKLELIDHIEKTFGLKLSFPTPYLSEKINIWKFEFNNEKQEKRPNPYSLAG